MKKIFITIFALTIALSAFGEKMTVNTSKGEYTIEIDERGREYKEKNLTQDEKERILAQNLVKKLRRLELKYISQLEKEDRTEASKMISEIRELIRKLNKDDKRYREFYEEEYEKEIYIPKETKKNELPMDDGLFQEALTRIKAQSFDEEKIAELKMSIGNKKISVSQCSELLKAMMRDESRTEVLKLVYPNVLDKNYGFTLIDCFVFNDDKENARVVIDRINTGPAEQERLTRNSRILIEDDRYFIILDRVKKLSFDEDKYAELKTAISGNVITTAQCGEILKLFLKGDVKLSVLSMLYPYVIDKDRGYTLVDYFTFNSEKSEARDIIGRINNKLEFGK